MQVAALRDFGYSVARLRRARVQTRAEWAHAGPLSELEIAFAEWGLLSERELQARLPALAHCSGIALDTWAELYRSLVAPTGATIHAKETRHETLIDEDDPDRHGGHADGRAHVDAAAARDAVIRRN
jgi:hypothetical protein